MRIAFVYDAVYPWVKGGAERRVWEVSRRLAERGHDVHVFGMKYWEGPEVTEREGVTLHGVCDPMELYVGGRRSVKEALYFASKVTGPLLGEEFDVVDCQEFPYFPVFSTKLHEVLGRSRLLVTWHEVWGDYWYDYLGWKGVFGDFVERAALRLPREVIAASEKVERDLEEAGRTEGVTVVPNGIDLEAVESVEPFGEGWEVFFAGRLTEHKNVDVLLEAVKVAKESLGRDVSCCVVGDGPERGALERRAEELGIEGQVEFAGFLDGDEEVLARMKSSEVFASPSVREGFGMSVLEAQACGLPVVVAEHPDNASVDLVEEGENGLVVEASGEAFGEALVELLKDEALRSEMGEKGAERAEGYDWGRVTDGVEEVYRRMAR